MQFLPRHLSLEQNRRRPQQPPSPEEPPPSRGPYSCIPRRCPLREPLPLRSRSPFLSVPVAAPLAPSRRRRRTLFCGTFRLASVLIVPSSCFCDSCSCCSSFCLCNFSVGSRFYLVLKSIVVCSNVDLGFREIFADFVAYVCHFVLCVAGKRYVFAEQAGRRSSGYVECLFLRLCLFCLMFI